MFDINKLEFDLVLSQLKKYVLNPVSLKKFEDITFYTNEEELAVELDKVDESLVIIKRSSRPPLGNISDMSYILKRATLGANLSVKELSEVLSLLNVVRENKLFLEKLTKNEIEVVFYKEAVESLDNCLDLMRLLSANIKDYQLVDTASKPLFDIRKKIKQVEQEIDEVVKNILLRSTYLSEKLVTMKSSRICLPVKAEYKNKFDGIIHDISNSGETLFIEPKKVVELQNKKERLINLELAEVEKILTIYTAEVANYESFLTYNFNTLINQDIIFSKAKYAIDNDCTKVELTKNQIFLKNARHPLIDQDKVVANTIDYQNNLMILITGPNTGGKTVTLKTLGLLALMNQFGMLLPVSESSKMMVFDHVFADIGDEQSIAENLSTFSSHMTKIIKIFKSVNNRSLVLLDELCSGTDPKEGASLAISILSRLLDYQAFVMATTHYSELKTFAYNHPKIVNASTEFDIDTLKPTYKLSIGVPGKSNAFDISLRLGLEERIINDAKNNMGIKDIEIESLIKSLETSKKYYESLSDELIEKKKNLENKEEALLIKESEIDQKSYTNKEKAKQEALKIVDEAKEKVNAIIKELKNTGHKPHELNVFKKELDEQAKNYQKEHLVSKTNHNFQVGDIAKVLSYNQTGTILKVLSNNEFLVSMGILRTTLKKNNLEFIKNEKKEIVSSVSYKKNLDISLSLDIRGYRVEEGIAELDKYIDSLIVAGIKQASVIHGVGTNALRTAVWQYLKNSKNIKEYSIANANEGGAGNTIIKLF